MAKKHKGTPPEGNGGKLKAPSHKVVKEGFPILSLARLQPRFGVDEMSEHQRSEFLVKWHKRSQLTWTELERQGKHGLGSEKLPMSMIRPRVPEFLEDEDKITIYRHEGNLPFAGFRAADVFYVIWIETKYGDLYDHGSR